MWRKEGEREVKSMASGLRGGVERGVQYLMHFKP
jgi:hypothetical protein